MEAGAEFSCQIIDQGTETASNEDPGYEPRHEDMCAQLQGFEAAADIPEHEETEHKRANVDPAIHNQTATLSPAVRLAELRRKKLKGSRTNMLLMSILEEAKEDTTRRERAAASEHANFMMLMRESNNLSRQRLSKMDERAAQSMLDRDMYLERMDGIVSTVSVLASSLQTLTHSYLEQHNASASGVSVGGNGGRHTTETSSVPLQHHTDPSSAHNTNASGKRKRPSKATGKENKGHPLSPTRPSAQANTTRQQCFHLPPSPDNRMYSSALSDDETVIDAEKLSSVSQIRQSPSPVSGSVNKHCTEVCASQLVAPSIAPLMLTPHFSRSARRVRKPKPYSP
ncbi:uncharacterized protein LOC133379817 isoform X2 [Rhineura floridana]|uniref:uncharacterized protein LOC133379817 isoform X2 n=1 Tax=Rhineura floridana TaxID=261503 RepID=UPI002AC80F3D|nr:uncharacterized protein LOC133379817 isoform X2 [Rhineura floridana]